VTKVGEAPRIVGETGFVIEPGDHEGLANAWEKFLTLSVAERLRLGKNAKDRVLQNYALESTVRQYENLYAQAAS
jgi:glycosyltransferase involved in cell wall biosynthesis